MMRITLRGDVLLEKKLNKRMRMYRLFVSRGIRRWGNDFARFLQMSTKAHNWRGKLTKSIRWEQRRRGLIGNLFMLRYGIALDRMPPHYVSLKRGRKITQWAKDKGFTGRSIFVKPHPFIDRIYSKHRPKLRKYVFNEIQKSRL